MKKTLTIFVNLDNSRIGTKKILRGIATYSNHVGPWKIIYKPPFYRSDTASNSLRLPQEKVDGIITYITNDRQGALLKKLNIPSIVIPMQHLITDLPNITEKWHKTGKIACEYLISLGLKNLAFCGGIKSWFWSKNRQDFFCKYIIKKGFQPYLYKPSANLPNLSLETELPDLKKWIQSLPKPVGIVTWNDERGRDIINICTEENINIPDDVAVIGMDNDDLICDLCTTPLSSIAFNHEKTGYQAAELIEQMITGNIAINKHLEIEPLYIVPRKSTDILQINDRDVANAINYIKNNSMRNISVQDVAGNINVSLRTLQKKFKKHYGISIHRKIMNNRIQRVCKMLEETTLTVTQISQKLNFSEVSDLNRSFKKTKNITPLQYRNTM